jgi:hypothetical protein
MAESDFHQGLIELFDKNVKASYTINQISKLLKKPYAYTHAKIKKSADDNVIKIRTIGRSSLCSLNLREDKAVVLLILNEIKKKKQFASFEKANQALIENTDSIRFNFDIYTVVLDKSADKLIFVLRNAQDSEKIKKSLVIKKYPAVFMSLEQFRQSILKSEILQNHIVLCSFEKYFEILQSVEKDLQYLYSPI